MSEYSRAELAFNSKTEAERKAIQDDLVWTGDYSQLVDGLFGNNTFKSIKSYEGKSASNSDGVLQPWERARLRQDAQGERDRVGFKTIRPSGENWAFGLPLHLLKLPKPNSDGTTSWNSKDGRFTVIAGPESYIDGSFASSYEALGNLPALDGTTYRTFRPGFFIITSEREGIKTYIRAVDTGVDARSMTIVWQGLLDDDIRKLVVAISNSVELIPLTKSAKDESRVETSKEDRVPESNDVTQSDIPPVKKPYQTGTGFFVSAGGYLITNAHVVEGCKEAQLRMHDGRLSRASIINTNERADLAILKSEVAAPASATFRNEPALRLGTDIIVFGYPRLDIFTSTGNLVNGLVSGLAGPGDDASLIQISAPVQSGNSGGAVLDRSGNVVGVVVAKTNITAEKDRIEVLQQANFAVNGDVAKSYLAENRIPFAASVSNQDKVTADIADAAKSFTAIVICEPS